jgi:hypothetical protein
LLVFKKILFYRHVQPVASREARETGCCDEAHTRL